MVKPEEDVKIKPGDDVIAYWGGMVPLRGKVFTVYGPPHRREVTVDFTPEMTDGFFLENTRVTFPIERVELATAGAG